ncbi:MAG: hypothetical protein IKA50_05350 [Clostridia bacterium]|nr:hypothetical protein [Clostridia bacterium]
MKNEVNEKNFAVSAEEARRRIREFDFTTGAPDAATMLFDSTAADGTLTVLYSDTDPSVLDGILCHAKMDWDNARFEQSADAFYRLVDTLKALAPHFDALLSEGADPATLIDDPAALQVYHTYCVPLDDGDFDMQRIYDISDRRETVALLESLKEMQERGEHLDEQALAYMEETEAMVTAEEEAYLAAYRAHLVEEAKQRVGDGVLPYDTFLRGQRLWMLHGLGAPEIILQSEEHEFTTAYMLHHHAVSLEMSKLEIDWDEEE